MSFFIIPAEPAPRPNRPLFRICIATLNPSAVYKLYHIVHDTLTYVRIYIQIHTCMCVYMYTYISMCVYIHTPPTHTYPHNTTHKYTHTHITTTYTTHKNTRAHRTYLQGSGERSRLGPWCCQSGLGKCSSHGYRACLRAGRRSHRQSCAQQ